MKTWKCNFEKEKKKTEERLLNRIETCELEAENSEEDGTARDLCLSLKVELLSLYHIDERNLM